MDSNAHDDEVILIKKGQNMSQVKQLHLCTVNSTELFPLQV